MSVADLFPDHATMLEQACAAFGDALDRCVPPLAGLAEPTDLPLTIRRCALGGAGQAPDLVELAYGGPVASEGPQLRVRTGYLRPRVCPAVPDEIMLRRVLVRSGLATDGFGPTAVTGIRLTIDGEPAPATRLQAGPRLWAARCVRGQIEVTVTARGWEPDRVALASVRDTGPYISAYRQQLAGLLAWAERKPRPSNAAVADPHRELVDAALRRDQTPASRILWDAAILHQTHLADQQLEPAHDAVTAMVNQLVQLQEEAPWFSDDPRLRNAAIVETLFYWSELRRTCRSEAAQDAWKRLWRVQNTPDPHYLRPPEIRHDPSRSDQLAAERAAWRDAWSAWATAAS